MRPAAPIDLDHLLATCEHDHLIDAFEKKGHDVLLHIGDSCHTLPPDKAARFLRGVLLHAPDLHTIVALFAQVTRTGPH